MNVLLFNSNPPNYQTKERTTLQGVVYSTDEVENLLSHIKRLIGKLNTLGLNLDSYCIIDEQAVKYVILKKGEVKSGLNLYRCLLYTSPSPRDRTRSRMPSSA